MNFKSRKNNYNKNNQQRLIMTKITINRDDIININTTDTELIVELKDNADKSQILLKDISVGETFKIGGEEWIVLEHFKDTTICLRKELLLVKFKFDDTTNNFSKSYINHFLNAHYAQKLLKLVGNNLCVRSVDLTSDDGLKDYGTCKSVYVSLLTCEQYRKYTDIMLKYNPKQWWWLATAYSTPTRGYRECVRAVLSDGTLSDNVCYSDGGGVRPVILLNNLLSVNEV